MDYLVWQTWHGYSSEWRSIYGPLATIDERQEHHRDWDVQWLFTSQHNPCLTQWWKGAFIFTFIYIPKLGNLIFVCGPIHQWRMALQIIVMDITKRIMIWGTYHQESWRFPQNWFPRRPHSWCECREEKHTIHIHKNNRSCCPSIEHKNLTWLDYNGPNMGYLWFLASDSLKITSTCKNTL